MLTKTQFEMLDKRKNRELWESKDFDPKERKYIDFTLRRYIEKQFKSLDHLLQVLEVMPNDQIGSILTPKCMADLLKVVEKSIEIFPPAKVVPIEGEENKYQTERSYYVNFGSKLEGATDSTVCVDVTCPASDDEIEYWKMFKFSKCYLFDHIYKEITEHPPKCTLKELNQEILPSLNKIANQRGVFCKIEPVNTIVGTPTKDWGKSKNQLEDADEILNTKKKRKPLSH
ncbi:MAG TPA: hypothetical protein PKK68_02580 [Methanothrix soehngenii]|nr:hypothetical protein [Methanothrix soehngenii]